MYKNISKLNRQCPNNTVQYVVKSGDTLYKIATRNKTTIEVLLELNPELNTNLLIPGIVMCIPMTMNEVNPNCPSENRSNCPEIQPPISPIPPIMPMPPVVPPMEFDCEGQMYTIRSGDTLYNLARKYDITLYELLNANKSINPYNLQIGQVICIPVPEKKCPYGKVYTIAQGDTLESILGNFRISLSNLKEINKDLDPYNLKAGTVICVPAFMAFDKCMSEQTYIISNGDDLSSIAKKHSVSPSELLVLNPYMRPEDFKEIGLKICVPPPMMSYR
jgi:LysM repeat protein